MGSADGAWSQLMAESADSLRRQKEAYSEAEDAHSQNLQERIRNLDVTVAEHAALKGAFFQAIKKAAADQGIPLSSLIPGRTAEEINAFVLGIEAEGKRRFKEGASYDGLRAQGLVYRPRGVS